MRRLFDVILDILKVRFDAFAENTAEAIEDGDKLPLLKNAVLAVLTILALIGGSTAVLGLLYLGRKLFVPLIGGPVALAVLMKSYYANREDRAALKSTREERALLKERAEAVYDYVRDGLFLVLRTVSEYTTIIRPASPSAIETNARICVRDGVAVYQFNALLSEEVKDLLELRRTLDRALGQMLRNRELPGLPSKLASIDGRNYLPVQILEMTDLGSSVNIDVVFVNERSAALLERQRLLRIKAQKKPDVPYDEDF